MYEELVRLWSRTSRLMQQLCVANDIQYFHFLQPNQYAVDSKPMGSKERSLALSQYAGWGRFVRKAYPRLIEAVVELRAGGLPIYDLTEIFAGISEPIYTDGCCHVNRLGEELLSQAIGAGIGGSSSAKN